jgi:hypothetical protein
MQFFIIKMEYFLIFTTKVVWFSKNYKKINRIANDDLPFFFYKQIRLWHKINWGLKKVILKYRDQNQNSL